MDRHEAIYSMRMSLTNEELKYTIDYYGIQRKGNELLCPFHADKHFGACRIGKRNDGVAKCYACGKSFSPVDLVMHFENLNYPDAMLFLWDKILRRPLPEFDERKKEKRKDPLFSLSDLQAIGIFKPNARYAACDTAVTYDEQHGTWTPVSGRMRLPSFFEIMEKAPWDCAQIVLLKSMAAISEFRREKALLETEGSSEWTLYHDYPDILETRRSAYNKAISRAEAVGKKAEKWLSCHKSDASAP